MKNDLINFFVSVPRPYEICVPLAVEMPKLESIEFNDKFALVLFESAKDVPGGGNLGLLGLFDELQTKRTYLRYRIDGYCSRSLQNRTLAKALSCFKIAFQQALAKKLFVIGEGKPAVGILAGLTQYRVDKARIVSVDKTPDTDRIPSTELPIDISKFLHSLELNMVEKPVYAAVENDNLPALLRGYMRLPAALMVNEQPEAQRVKSAIQWCFDSYATENETLSFLQACFGLEALFGEGIGPNDPITRTLADRCAYLISSDIKGRKTIRGGFDDLYKARSKVVHGTSQSLPADQAYLLKWGRSILEYAIFKEIKHLGMEQ